MLYDTLTSPYIGSPSSTDSGVARSPLSSYDLSSPNSPTSPCSNEFEYVDPLPKDKTFPGIQGNSNPEELNAKSNHTLPAEKTVKKLLELIVAAKTAGERSLISNLLTTLVANSLKKDNTSISSISNVLEQPPRKVLKRPAASCSENGPCKKVKTAVKAPAPVKPSIIMVEQPEQVCASFMHSQ